MQGYRVGVAVGNQPIINALTRVKSHMDSGIPPVIQEMAIAALNGPQDSIAANNVIYQRRRDRVMETLHRIGIKAETPRASLYVWCHNPGGMKSMDFASQLIEETNVVVTPGSGFGANGEGYFRISLTVPDHRLDEAMKRLEAWHATMGAPVSRRAGA
jgi:LL-diaminopimelate aminotransferase